MIQNTGGGDIEIFYLAFEETMIKNENTFGCINSTHDFKRLTYQYSMRIFPTQFR